MWKANGQRTLTHGKSSHGLWPGELKTIIWPWGQRSRSHKGHYSMRHTALWSCTYKLSVNEQFCWIYLNYLTLRSKVTHKGHYGMQHTTLWSCTHIPIIIDLSWKTKSYGPNKKILFKKQLFDLEVKGQGHMKVIMVRDTPSYGHAPTYEISLTYLERQKSYGQTSFAEKKRKKQKKR